MAEPEPSRATRFSLVDVRTGERGPLLSALFTLFGLVAAHALLETARDALFLEQLAPSWLPLVYLVVALLGIGLTDLNARFIRRFGRKNALVVTTTVFAIGTVWFHFRPVTPWVAFGLYVWSALVGSISVVQFWLFAGDAFTTAQSKRFFPTLSAGGVLGAVIGSGLAVLLLWLLPFGSLLLAAALLALGTAFVAASSPEPDAAPSPAKAPKLPLGGGFALLLRDRYVRRVAVLGVSATLALLTLDYLFKSRAAATLPKHELGPFFARYYGVLNTAALVVQIAIAGRVVRRFGVAVALTVLPLALLGGAGLAIALGGSFALLLFAKGADGALRHSLHRVGTELLYLPLDAEVRDRAKPLIDSVLARVAQAVGAGGLLVLALSGLAQPLALLGVVIFFSLIWIVTAASLRRPYLDLFRRALGRGAEYSGPALDELDLGAAETVIEALSSPDPARAVAAMNLLADAGRARLIPALILYHDREEVLLRALEVLPEARREDWVPLAKRLLESPTERVVTAAARALSRHGKLPAIEQPKGALRAYLAVERLARDRAVDPVRDQEIAAVLEGSSVDCQNARRALSDAISDTRDPHFLPVVERLAKDPSLEVAEAALGAIAALGRAESIPLLVELLEDPLRRAHARLALTSFGERALEALGAALTDPGVSERVRREVPRAVGEVGGERAATVLLSALVGELPGLVRFRVLRALGRMARSHGIRLDRQRLEPELTRNLIEYLRLAALALAFERTTSVPDGARASDKLLRGLVSDKMRQARERAFRILQLLHQNEDLRSVYFALESPDRRARANALEFIEALTLSAKDDVRELLRWVIDDLSLAERVERSEALVPGRPRTLDAALASMLGDGDEAMATLAAYHVRALAVVELDDEAEAVFSQRRWSVFEGESVASGEGGDG